MLMAEGDLEIEKSPASFYFLGLRQEEVDILAKTVSSESAMVGVRPLCACSCSADHVSWDR